MKYIVSIAVVIVVCSSSYKCIAQPLADFRYADMHAHTTLKGYYNNVPFPDAMYSPSFAKRIKNTNWKERNVKVRKRGQDGLPEYKAASASRKQNKKTSYNQTSFDLVNKGQGSFIHTTLYALEKQSASNRKVPLVLNGNQKLVVWGLTPFFPLGGITYLIPSTRVITKTYWEVIFTRNVKIKYVNSLAVTKLPIKRLDAVADGDNTSFEEFCAEIKYLEQNLDGKVVIVKDSAQLDGFIKQRQDGQKIPSLIFLNCEGAHNFYGHNNSSIKNIYSHKCDQECKGEVYSNIRKAKDTSYRLFSIGMGHLFSNKMVGCSRGLDIDRPEWFREILAKSMWEKGFSTVDAKYEAGFYNTIRVIGKVEGTNCDCQYDTSSKMYAGDHGFGTNIIDSVLDNNNRYHKRTYIDTRHMDVAARSQLIQHYTSQYWSKGDTIPIIVSHAAYSGENQRIATATGLCPMADDYREFIDYKDFLSGKLFQWDHDTANKNCQRCIGIHSEEGMNKHIDSAGWFHTMSTNLYTEEIAAVYQSKGIIGLTFEERALGATAYNYKKNKATKNNLRKYITHNDHGGSLGEKTIDSLCNAEPFVRNLFAIITHSGYAHNDIRMWEHICLGTDFDGIMNPIDICPTAADIPHFYSFLCTYLDFYIKYLGYNDTVKCGKSSTQLMNMLFYKNLEDFTIKYF